MANKTKHFSVWLACGAVAGLAILVLLMGGESDSIDTVEGKGVLKSRVRCAKVKDNRSLEKRQNRLTRIDGRKTSVRKKPNLLDFTKSEEDELNGLARQVLDELQQALDADDFQSVQAALNHAMSYSHGELGGGREHALPPALRRRFVEALGWFGATAMPELLTFAVDADPDIAHMTAEQFEQALQDTSLSDYDRAAIIVSAAQVLTDADTLDVLYTDILNMRPSVIADTVADVLQNGTQPAKDLMGEQVEFYTDVDVKTIDDVHQWRDEHPDDEDADEMYGGEKEDT